MALNENAKKWVEALRSGKYSQGKGTLQNRAGYCCLGVACDVYEKETGNELPKNDEDFYEGHILFGAFEQVKDWLNLKTSNANFGEGSQDNLVAKNDRGNTFDEIAEVIESEPKDLFNN